VNDSTQSILGFKTPLALPRDSKQRSIENSKCYQAGRNSSTLAHS
jgi:hypothetical protein